MNNKHLTPAVLILLFLISCTKEPEVSISQLKVKEITYQTEFQNYSEKFTYLPDGKLNRKIKLSTNTTITQITYDVDKIKQITTYSNEEANDDTVDDESKVIQTQEFFYDENNRVDSMTANGSTLDPNSIFFAKFQYDSLDNIIGLESYESPFSNEINYSEKYLWENGNIVHSQNFNKEGCLLFEEFFSYDEKNNFYPTELYVSPIARYSSKNNVTQISLKYDCLPFIKNCEPCINQYTYNSDNYPIMKEAYAGTLIEIFYL